MLSVFRKYYPFIFLIGCAYFSFSYFHVPMNNHRSGGTSISSQQNLLSESLALYKAGRKDSSIIYLDTVIALASSVGTKKYAYKALIQKAFILKNQGLYKAALYLLDSFNIEEDSLMESERLINKADVFISLGYYFKADSCINRADKFINTTGDSVLLLRVNTLRADICFYTGRFPEGFKYAETAVSFYPDTDKNKILFSEVCNVLGKLSFGTKDYSSALHYFGKALEIRESYYGTRHSETAKIFHNIGSTYYDMADLENAESYLKKALDIRTSTLGEMNPSTADSYNNLGNLYQAIGELDLAAVYLRKALAIREETLGRFNNAVVITYNNLGNVYLDKKQFSEAYRCYLTGLELKSLISSAEGLENILLYNNLGIVLKQQKKYKEALSYFRRAIGIETKLLGPHHLWSAFTNLNIGATYTDLKNYEKSREYLLKALNNLKYIPGKKHPLKAELLYELALVDYARDDMKAGLENLQEAMTIIYPGFNPVNVFENPTVNGLFLAGELVNILEKKGEIFLKMSSRSYDIEYLTAAKNAFSIASGVLDKIRRSYKAERSKIDLSNTAKSLYEKGLITSYKLYKKTGLTDYLDQAFIYSEKSRSLKLLESIIDTKAKLSGNIPDSLLEHESRLKQACLVYEHKLKAAFDNGLTFKSEEVALLNSGLLDMSLKHEKLMMGFEKNHPDYYRLKYSIDITDIREVQDILTKDQTIIEYFLGEESLYLFMISEDNSYVKELQKPKKLNEEIQQLRQSIVQMDYGAYTKYAFSLYMEIFEPVEPYLTGTDVIIIPDGTLGYIPFEALLSKPAAQKFFNYKNLSYLIRKYQFSYSNSCTLLKEGLAARLNPAKNKVGGYAPEAF